MRPLLRSIDRLVGLTTAAGMVLVLPISLLLFLQWPLREWVQAYSREANDLAQALFALYVSIAITCASRQRVHLACDAFAQRYGTAARQLLLRIAALIVLIPWSLFLLVTAWPIVLQSVRELEGFPDTFNPGYFVIKIALFLLALLVLLQAILEVLAPRDAPPP